MSQTTKRILYIEDEEAAQMGLRAILEAHGHTVDVAENGDRAIELMKITAYELVLIDVMFDPGSSLQGVPHREAGKELLVRLRAGRLGSLQTEANVTAIAITAVADLGINRALQEAGVRLILQKPIDPEEAFEQVQQIVN